MIIIMIIIIMMMMMIIFCLSPGQCGVTFPETQAAASHRIVGGTRTLRGEFPWQVMHQFTAFSNTLYGR